MTIIFLFDDAQIFVKEFISVFAQSILIEKQSILAKTDKSFT